VTGARYALAFLTRLPGGSHARTAEDLAAAVTWFPAVGALVGLLVAAVHVPLAGPLPALSAAAIAVGVAALVTGGFHEDGFADSLDALAGGRDVEHRLAILKDSRHGTFGVLGLVVLTLVKVSALAALDGAVAVAALVAAGSLGRAGAVGLMGLAPPASGSGLGASYLRALTPGRVIGGVALGVALGTAALGTLVLPAVGLVAAGAAAVALWARRRIGGVTGDLLGAAEQVGECVVLLLVAGVAPEQLGPIGWW
jgi:adenosylcobinamide-GDP ribazoletransferase